MAFIPTSMTAKFSLVYRLYGQDVVNTIWMERADEAEWVEDSLEDMNIALRTWCQSEVLPLLSNDISIHEITGIAQWSQTAPGVITSGGDVAGSVAGVSMPGGTCVTVSFKSNARGRSYRGRNYVSGIPSSVVTGNQINATFQADLLAAYNELAAVAIAQLCTHVVVSHYTNNAARSFGVTVPVLLYTMANRDLDSQRRRLTGRGT